jgi:hypothetical protein
MLRLHVLRSLTAIAIACLFSLHAMAGESYEQLDPSEISCGVKGASYTKSSTATGYRFIGLSVEKLICEGREISLVSRKFDGDFLTTRDYGKIKILLGENTLTPSFSIWLTPDQKKALLTTLKAAKMTPRATQ